MSSLRITISSRGFSCRPGFEDAVQLLEDDKTEQADHIWKNLFIERSVGEACRGVLTTCKARLDTGPRDLKPIRKWFAAEPLRYIDKVMQISNVS